ncbi:MAG: TolC family protein [Bacteroidota bacterium]
MFSKYLSIVAISLLLLGKGYSQSNTRASYDLASCVAIALENNLDLKRSGIQAESAGLSLRQSKNNLLPNLNANYNLGINNGRSINPSTNDFINERLTFSNVGLGGEATLFNAFRLKNSIKQNQYNVGAAEMEMEEVRQNLILNVTLNYIQILTARAQLKLAETRLETTAGQVERLRANYEEGQGNPADFTDMQGQYGMDEMAVLNAKNNLNESILNLFVSMGVEASPQADFADISGNLEEDKYLLSADAVYQDALANLPAFKARQLRIEEANSAIKVARADFFPEISLFGQIGSNFSSVSRAFFEAGSEVKETGDFISLNNQSVPVLTNETNFRQEKIAYLDQFNNNRNSVVGVGVSIPLFNRFQAKNQISQRKLELRQSTIELQNSKLQFRQAVEDAHFKMENAFSRYQILKRQLEAYESSFRINEIRFNNGVSNIVQYLTSKNNLDTARLNLSNAKFEYILRVRILEYYRGL